MTDKPTVIIIHETPIKSWVRDASVFTLFFALVGVGWLMGSGPMQWAGFIVACITVLHFAAKEAKPMTIPDARKELDRIENGGN